MRTLKVFEAKGFVVGLHALLDRLECQLDGTALPDFATHFTALLAEYPVWSHATDPRK